jgi:hypothetical protein
MPIGLSDVLEFSLLFLLMQSYAYFNTKVPVPANATVDRDQKGNAILSDIFVFKPEAADEIY